MLKCNWSTIVFENHGGSFNSTLRWLPSRAGSFAGTAMTDNSLYWRWSKRLTGPLLTYYHSIYVFLPSISRSWKFLPYNLAKEKGCVGFFFFSDTFSLLCLISNCYMEMTKWNRHTVENQSLYHKQKVRILVKNICFMLSLACFLLVSPSCSSQIFFVLWFSAHEVYIHFFSVWKCNFYMNLRFHFVLFPSVFSCVGSIFSLSCILMNYSL